MTKSTITITQPDDWHLHLRDGAVLAAGVLRPEDAGPALREVERIVRVAPRVADGGLVRLRLGVPAG